MGIEPRRNPKTGELVRTSWYCRIQINGNRTSYSLNVPIKGKLPISWIPSAKHWPLEDKGDEWFEKSRARALEAYEKLRANPPTYKTDDATEAFYKIVKSQSGKKLRPVKIRDLVKNYDQQFGNAQCKATDNPYTKWLRNIIVDFVKWWESTGRKAKTQFHFVKVEDAKAYFDYKAAEAPDGKRISSDTIKRIRAHLKRTFAILCPYAKHINPFDQDIATPKNEEVVHRDALSEEEMSLVLKTAEETDPLLYDLIVTGLSTALRKGDICCLKWTSITDTAWTVNNEVRTGSVKVKTSKTGELVDIPIFPLFKTVIKKRLSSRKDNEKFVFPEAAVLYKTNPDALTRRIKIIFAKALAAKKGANATDNEDELPHVSPSEALPIVMKALETAKLLDSTKANILSFMPLYAEGKTYRQISAQTGAHLHSISNALRKAEAIAKAHFITPSTIAVARAKTGYDAIVSKVTRTTRAIGKKAASIYDFPCLRTSFITQAARHGVPIDVVRKVTGHTDTRMIEQYYNRASATDLAPQLLKAIPSALTSSQPAPPATASPSAAPSLPTTAGKRKTALSNLSSFLSSADLSAKERKQLINALLSDDES